MGQIKAAPQNNSSWLEFSTYSDIQGAVVGVDEVGRGALFGPVVAAAVILPVEALSLLVLDNVSTSLNTSINDSKKLSSSSRTKLSGKIMNLALEWRIGYATTAEIDKLNILQATLLAMKRAVLKLQVTPKLCLIDGNQLVKNLPIPQETIVKGDERSLNIAAASIMAKVWRDDLVQRLALKYPMYDIENNKGYGSQRHLLALQKYGPSPLHRRSFGPCQTKAGE